MKVITQVKPKSYQVEFDESNPRITSKLNRQPLLKEEILHSKNSDFSGVVWVGRDGVSKIY